MKKKLLTLIVAVGIASIIAIQCHTTLQNPKTDNEKIKILYDNSYGDRIIEVDGHLYFSNYRGGTVHLESCPCKSKAVK